MDKITAGNWSREPTDDDIERANCDKAGQIGHYGCGICKHGLPTWQCHECWVAACKGQSDRKEVGL